MDAYANLPFIKTVGSNADYESTVDQNTLEQSEMRKKENQESEEINLQDQRDIIQDGIQSFAR